MIPTRRDMKRNKFLFKSRRDLFLLFVYVVTAGVFLCFSSGGFIINFRRVGFSFMSGIQRGLYSVSSFFSNTFNAVRELSDLREKYNLLEERLKEYETLQRSNAEIRKENDRLRELLSFTETVTMKNIPAEIIGRDPSNLYSGITINRGAKHGVRKNMPVLSFQNSTMGLVGKIVQVGRSTSMIMPLYDLQCFVPSRMEDNRFYGLVNGQGDAESPLIMQYVQKRAKEEIKNGERIVTAGESENYPRDIAVGTVVGVQANDYENSIKVLINPVVDFAKLDTVIVLDVTAENENPGAGD